MRRLFSFPFIFPATFAVLLGTVSGSEPPSLLGTPVYDAPSATALFSTPTVPSASPTRGTVFFSHGDPTNIEQYMLEMVNRARRDPAAEAARFGIDLNAGLPDAPITTDPKAPLAFHPQLMQAARGHSQWMLDSEIFSHNGENGATLRDRTNAAGYPEFSYVGENIAWRGWTDPIEETIVEFAEEEIKNLFLSPSHRLSTLREEWLEIGVGCKTGPFPWNGDYYNALMTTMDFGASTLSPEASPGSRYLTGVVYEDLDGNGFYTPGEGIPNVRIAPENNAFYTETSASGGYALPIPGAGETLKVTVSGDRWPVPATYEVIYSGCNIKLDVVYTGPMVVIQSYGSGSTTPDGAITIDTEATVPTELAATAENGHFFIMWDDPAGILTDATVATTTISAPAPATVTAVFTGGDYDQDTLPDLWEFTYFGNLLPEPDGDEDGDGYTNAEEAFAELNPDRDDSDLDIITLHEGWNMFIPTNEIDGLTVREAFGTRALPNAWVWDAQQRVFKLLTEPLSPRTAVWLYATETFAVTTPTPR